MRIKNPPLKFATALAAIPIIILLIFVIKYSVNIPYWDQWDILYLFDKYDKSELVFSDLWLQHNEHRLIFPKLLFLGIGIISKFDVRWEMLTTILLAVLLYLLIVRHVNKNKEALQIENSYRTLWIIFSTFLFSLSQSENWLWGFQIQWLLNLLAVAAGGFILANRRINFSAICMLACCGIVATFSLSSGVIYWIIVLFLLIIYQVKTTKKINLYLITSWVVIAGIVILIYLSNYQKPAAHPDLFSFVKQPVQFLNYIARYIGSPLNFFGDSNLKSFLFGPLGILIFSLFSISYIYREKDHPLQSSFFFIHIGLYSILSAVLTALGRSGLGVDQAESSRYISVSIFLWISVVYMLFSAKNELRIKSGILRHGLTFAKIIILAAVFISMNLKSYNSIPLFRETHASRAYGQYAVQYGTSLDGLKNVFPDPYRLLGHDIPLLKRLKLSVFKDQIPEIAFEYEPDNWLMGEGWSFDGIYNFSKLHIKSENQYVIGSWSGADSNTGSIRSKTVIIENPVVVSIPIIHGPDVAHQKIGARIEGEKSIELLCDLNSRNHSWGLCRFDVSPYTGKKLTIFAEDEGQNSGQWIGFARPVLINSK